MLKRFLPCVLLLATAVLVTRAATAQAPATPGAEHERLKKMVGTWDAVVIADQSESKAVANFKLDLGGLWLISSFEGDFGGMPFKGMGIDGYDTAKKKYVSVWIDSMSTSPMLTEGTYDADSKTLTLSGKGPGPGGQEVEMKMVTVFVDDDHMNFTMYLVDAQGSESKMMTIRYTRRKE